jgi:hypothetical protein
MVGERHTIESDNFHLLRLELKVRITISRCVHDAPELPLASVAGFSSREG